MATRSLLFGMIGILQSVAVLLSFLGHFPTMVIYGWKNFALSDPDFATELVDKNQKLMYGVWRHCIDGKIDSCEQIKRSFFLKVVPKLDGF